ncbi:pentapeptide repeat-containing protein, partial [Desulfatibacillum alkenivorans]|uniref:pentapeptide repeat-containing protein n=1 Tax=Desulfatibacillum alkenivorans TaxID=259354 RepID=UPI003CC8030B
MVAHYSSLELLSFRFSGTSLKNSTFSGTSLTSRRFSGTSLKNSTFSGTSLTSRGRLSHFSSLKNSITVFLARYFWKNNKWLFGQGFRPPGAWGFDNFFRSHLLLLTQ